MNIYTRQAVLLFLAGSFDDRVDLDQGSERQPRDLDARPSGKSLGVRRFISPVVRGDGGCESVGTARNRQGKPSEEGVVQGGLAGSSCSLHVLLKGGCCRLQSRRENVG